MSMFSDEEPELSIYSEDFGGVAIPVGLDANKVTLDLMMKNLNVVRSFRILQSIRITGTMHSIHINNQ